MLDLLGGTLAFSENAVAGNLTGNLPKMLLSVLCLLYDTILLAQHFICFGPGRRCATRNYTKVAPHYSPVVQDALAYDSHIPPELRVRRACQGDIEESGSDSGENGDAKSS